MFEKKFENSNKIENMEILNKKNKSKFGKKINLNL